MATILELVQAACYEGNIAAPQTLVGSSLDLSTLQLVHLTHATGRELRAARVWPQLKRIHTFPLEANRTAYRLPTDFYATLPGTEYTRDHSEPLQPLSDHEWNARLYGCGVSCCGREFRIFGPDTADGGQFHVTPTPGTSDAGSVLSYEYITASWLVPDTWTVWSPGKEAFMDELVLADSKVYRAFAYSVMGSLPPTVDAKGVGQDGSILWKYVTFAPWAQSTAYAAGDRVSTGPSAFYIARKGGLSAPTGTGPSGTSPNIADGSVIWASVTVLTWTPNTAYAAYDYISIAGLMYYATNSGTSAERNPYWIPYTDAVAGPTFRQQDSSNPLMTWVYIQSIQNPYDKILYDIDRCLFDDELMIAGLKWRFLRARGLEYRDLELEYNMHKDSAVSRLQPMQVISLVDGGRRCGPRIPDGSWVL